MTLEGLLLAGVVAGLAIGLVAKVLRTGCLLLLAVPFSMVIYISWWQEQHSEALRSTSGLDFFFGPLWPSIGAIIGFPLGIMIRSHLKGE